jgi:hypothetical protein
MVEAGLRRGALDRGRNGRILFDPGACLLQDQTPIRKSHADDAIHVPFTGPFRVDGFTRLCEPTSHQIRLQSGEVFKIQTKSAFDAGKNR